MNKSYLWKNLLIENTLNFHKNYIPYFLIETPFIIYAWKCGEDIIWYIYSNLF